MTIRGTELQHSQTWLLNALQRLEDTLISEYQQSAAHQLERTGPRPTKATLKIMRRMEASIRQKAKRDAIQQQLISDAGGECRRCHKNYHPNIYDFHHKDPSQKEFNLDRSNFNRSWQKIREEARKCVLLCANCHREVHTFMDKRFLLYRAEVPLDGD